MVAALMRVSASLCASVSACALALLWPPCLAGDSARAHYSPTTYLKNYALSACLAGGYQSKDVVDDATAAANGYMELGSLGVDAYNEALALSQSFLARDYKSISGEKLIMMKCIDLYHSKELDRLARKHAGRR